MTNKILRDLNFFIAKNQRLKSLTVLNSQGTLDDAYFKSRSQELDRKLLTAHKQLRASLDGEEYERLDELRKLIAIFEKSKPITEFDEVKLGQIVSKITVLSELEIRFDLIGNEDFKLTEYDDVTVRQFAERVVVECKNCITVRFKGGFEVRKELENGS